VAVVEEEGGTVSEMDLHEGADEAAAVPGEAPVSPEAPEADALEQRTEVSPPEEADAPTVPDGVDPADRYEQERVVELDEDDYR
jgi:hypothetical protein